MTLEEQVGQLTGRVYQLEQEVEKLKKLSAATDTEVNREPIVKTISKPIEEAVSRPEAEAVAKLISEPADGIIRESETHTAAEFVPEPEPSVVPEKSETPEQSVAETYAQEHYVQAAPLNNQAQPQPHSIYPQVNMGKHAPKEKSSMEKTFGIKVMAILASLLVFVSLILFGSLVFEYIPVAGKIGIMALVSAIFAGVGLVNMKKKTKLKVLFSALAGCGIGGLYITIIVAAFLIESIHLPVMLIMLGAWTLFVILLSKFMSKLFIYICYAGVAVTTIYFGYFGDGSLVAIIYYFVSTLLLFAVNYTGSFFSDSFFFIQLPIAAVVLCLFYEETMWVFIAMIALVAVVMLAQLFAYKLTRRDIPTLVIYEILSYISIYVMAAGLGDDFRELNYVSEVAAAILILIAVAYGVKYYNRQAVIYYPVFYLTAILLWTLPYSDFVDKYIGASVFMLALILAGVLKDNKHFKYTGYVYFLAYAIQMNDARGIPAVIAFAVMLAAIALVIVHNRIRYSMSDKYAAVVGMGTLVGIIGSWNYINHTTAFIILAIISIVINKKWFELNPFTGDREKVSAIIAYVVNAVMMVWGGLLLINCEHNLVIVEEIENSSLLMIMAVSLLTIAMFAMNTVELFNLEIPESVVGVYICAKFSWLVWAILTRLSAEGYVVSLIGVALAIAFIVTGFKFKKKSFRYYGLVLTIICVIKLILVDIEYNYDILKPLSYLLAGVLCFGISWLYSRIEKKEKREEQN